STIFSFLIPLSVNAFIFHQPTLFPRNYQVMFAKYSVVTKKIINDILLPFPYLSVNAFIFHQPTLFPRNYQVIFAQYSVVTKKVVNDILLPDSFIC
ncbi:hypothetical protein, partial [Okeania sp.]|uniref:hypothetical protein n=1 Tax=Okeania sp. TaxID=3100323 RepID=UPI002B4ADAF8